MAGILLSGFTDEISDQLEDQFRAASKLDLDAVCLRGAGGRNICTYTPEEIREKVLPLKETYGLAVSSLGSPIGKISLDDGEAFARQLKLAEQAAKAAAILGCRYIRIFSFYTGIQEDNRLNLEKVVKRLRPIIDIFASQGVAALHENEKDIFGDTGERCKMLFDMLGGEYFAGAFDFANFVQCGEDPLECYNQLKPYIRYFHIKDARYDSQENVVCGTGDGKIRQIITRAVHDGYRGYCTLEPHLAVFESLKELELKPVEEVIRENGVKDGFTGFCMQKEAFETILNSIKGEEI